MASVVLASCTWGQPAFDSGRSNSNAFEVSLRPDNVGQLEGHVIPSTGSSLAPLVLTVGDSILIGNFPAGVDAYPANACPRSDNGPCTARWHADGQLLTTDLTTTFVTAGATTFAALDSNGAPLRTFDTTPAPGFGLVAASVSGPYLLAQLVKPGPTPTSSDTEEIAVFSRGCSASACTPERTLSLFSKYGSNFHWAAQDDVLYAATAGGMSARSLATGTTLWQTNLGVGVGVTDIRLRGGLVYATGGHIYDAAGIQGCSGNPTICTPVRTLTGAYEVDSIASTRALDHVIPAGFPLPPSDIRFWRTDAVGCSGLPLTCDPVARTNPYAALSDPISTDRLAFTVSTVASIGNHYHLLAFDLAGIADCTGSPTVCAPLLDLDFSTVQGKPTAATNGRVYVPTTDGAVHVFSLPGDVG